MSPGLILAPVSSPFSEIEMREAVRHGSIRVHRRRWKTQGNRWVGRLLRVHEIKQVRNADSLQPLLPMHAAECLENGRGWIIGVVRTEDPTEPIGLLRFIRPQSVTGQQGPRNGGPG